MRGGMPFSHAFCKRAGTYCARLRQAQHMPIRVRSLGERKARGKGVARHQLMCRTAPARIPRAPAARPTFRAVEVLAVAARAPCGAAAELCGVPSSDAKCLQQRQWWACGEKKRKGKARPAPPMELRTLLATCPALAYLAALAMTLAAPLPG